MRFVIYILFPIQIIYSVIIRVKNVLYNKKIFKTYKMEPYIISIGNIKNGGTGKTPLVEYTAQLLKDYNIAILSRGYGRQTKGFVLAQKDTNQSFDIGDESSQLYNKLKNITIATDENRVNGVKQLLKHNPKLEIIILDDGYQHRKLHRDINILLTEYDKLLTQDCLMPIGSLREHKKEIKRADIIIITKCPEDITKKMMETVKKELKLTDDQKIYFSIIKQHVFIDTDSFTQYTPNPQAKHLLITGIENPIKLLDFLSNKKIHHTHLKFADHYNFRTSDIRKFIKIKTQKKLSQDLLLTEKDYYRLSENHKKTLKKHFKLICIQIEIDFITNDKSNFNKQLLNFEKSKKK